MKTAVLFLNFGEPEKPTLEEVVPFLERIFMLNAALEGAGSQGRAQQRAHELAVKRAPGLIAEYEEIGGSPLNLQARAQASATARVLRGRGHAVSCYVGMQFTEPGIEAAVQSAHAEGVDLIVGLPVYPLFGPSTNAAALAQMRAAIERLGKPVRVAELGGWHSHSSYLELRADAIREVVREADVDLADPRTCLVFSAHGTPMKYLREGSRYGLYTEHYCTIIAEALDAPRYELGYQNHRNRPIEWTQPDIEDVIARVDADTVVVDACSFMHEQSETLAELDHELKEHAEARGLRFLRVPIPHGDARFINLLADLIEPVIRDQTEPAGFRPCRCKPGAICLNTVL